MQACNVTLPTPVIFSCIFGVRPIIPDSHLPKCTKTRLKWHNITHKTSKPRFPTGAPPQTPCRAYDAPHCRPYSAGGLDIDKLLPLSPPSLHVQCPLPEEKTIFCIATVIHDASANNSNSTNSDIAQTARYFVENRNENTNKQAFLQRSRAAYAWGIA